MPEKVIAKCSGNIIKNAMCVTVPNTGDLVGIKASSIIGVLAGDSSKELEVINEVKEEHIKKQISLWMKNIVCWKIRKWYSITYSNGSIQLEMKVH